MTRTRVVNKHTETYDLDVSRDGFWGNPFGTIGTAAKYIVDDPVASHAAWIKTQPGLLFRLRDLEGLVIACPGYGASHTKCHAVTIAEMVENYEEWEKIARDLVRNKFND